MHEVGQELTRVVAWFFREADTLNVLARQRYGSVLMADTTPPPWIELLEKAEEPPPIIPDPLF